MFIPAIIFLASATFAGPVVLADIEALKTEEVAVATEIKVPAHSLEAYVKEYFSDTPILADIARCESRFRHFIEDGEVIRGEIDSDDIGVMQINLRYHKENAAELGLNVFSLSGNLEYAKYLYEKQGVKPWKASRGCWGRLAQK